MTQLRIREDSPVGPLDITVVQREPADIQTFGGPPIVYDVHPAREPAEFTIDGHPYGGWLRVSPSGEKMGGRLYRAGCFGRPATEVERDVCEAAVVVMTPHTESIVESARKQQRDIIVAAIRRWAATAERHRLELAAAEANEQLARTHLLEQFGETLSESA